MFFLTTHVDPKITGATSPMLHIEVHKSGVYSFPAILKNKGSA